MFKKTSRSKNIRRKIEVTEDEPTELHQEEVVIKKTITKKKKIKPNLTSISFEEEGDTEEFQIKKSKASKRLNAEHKLRLLDTLDTLESPSTGLYDADSLKQLRENTATLPASLKATKMGDDDALLREKFPTQMTAKLEGGTSIPDSSAILAAKKKREQLRKNLNIIEEGEDFISLNDNEEESNTGSRLIREEDDIGDDGEAEFEKYVGEGFTLNKKSAKKQAQEHREAVREMIDEAQDDGEEDMERWEEDMMRFGGVKTKRDEFDRYAPPPNYRPAQIPEPSSIPSLSEVMSQLDVSSNEIAYNKKQYESNLSESKLTIENASTTLSDIDKEIERGMKRYDYFQQLAQYTNDLGEFFDAKYPELEKLEQEAYKLISTKTETAISRRRQDALDDLVLFVDIPNAILNTDTEMEPEVDEFGRVNELRNSETARNRRRAERKQRQSEQQDFSELTGEDLLKAQGMWSDDELQEEFLIQKDEKLQEIQNEGIDNLMQDVGEEFRTLSKVKEKFEAWKIAYFDDYQKAYGSLSLPGAFDFYIRTELVAWDPFSSPQQDFDQMEWHRVLSSYGVSEEHEDPDIEMINKVVEKTMIKKIKSLIDTLDAGASRDMRYAAQVMEQVSFYVDMNDKAYKDFASSIENTIETQIMHFAEIVESSTLKTTNLDEEAKERFIWSQCKYIKTLIHFRRYLPKEQLCRMGDAIMDRIIMPLLKIDLYPRDKEIQEEILSLLSRLKK